MSKKCLNGTTLLNKNGNDNFNGSSFKINEKLLSPFIDIGIPNIKRWTSLKTQLSCKTDDEFVSLLLDLAQKEAERKLVNNSDSLHLKLEINDELTTKKGDIKSNHDTPCTESELLNKTLQENDDISKNKAQDTLKLSAIEENEKEFNTSLQEKPLEKNQDDYIIPTIKKSIYKKSKKEANHVHGKSKHLKNKKKGKSHELIKASSETKNKSKKHSFSKKKVDHDIRKAPELNVQVDDVHLGDDVKPEIANSNSDKQRVAIKIKMCFNCDTRHVEELCPLQKALNEICDSLSMEEWNKEYKSLYMNDKTENEVSTYSFAYLSLPKILKLDNSNTSHGLSVFANFAIKEYTQFGPLLGTLIKEVDIPEDNSMCNLWEIYCDSGNSYMCTESVETSNWLRFIRPAPAREDRNIAAIAKENKLYFVTIKLVNKGEELLYWQDDMLKTHKKKMEKTICGGCNITFSHPLYYRTHCSVFHDVRYSLTIRKYHCKICGAAVLGKENIMKHAADLHNGQGAYQCQFCKKFFLRLNYLEIHRTYGCSANPHRSRPLCDFCGRKFCQPQKLKVHIKRMHSDMSEVLKEFQCKNCLKILGSRAALQRHLKEVHQKQVDGAYTCSRCGKLFQNKSNLKIHMLTHSGIKPFKCTETNCLSAFTTKQCLQFHYKKVHGFTEDMMPKIERSVKYTFEAYAGVDADGKKRKFTVTHDDDSDLDEENCLDEKDLDDPPGLHSPEPIASDQSSSTSPPMLDAYTSSNGLKVLSKGSKKWIEDATETSSNLLASNNESELYQIESRTEKEDINLVDTEEPIHYEQTSTFARREPTNASLLVEAALDSVCSEPNVDVEVGSATNCNDTLNNLYSLSHSDNLDVTYAHSIDMNETRDINLISPSVNDHISVTDDLSDDLRHSQNIGIDYSTFQQEDPFTPENSPSRNNFRDYINVNPVSPQDNNCQSKNVSPIPSSPPRYNFGHQVATAENLSSDDSNGMSAQNLSLHNNNDSKNIQLDLSIYKTSYNLDHNFQIRKDFRLKFDLEEERNKDYILNVDDDQKFMDGDNQIETNDLNDKDFDGVNDKNKDNEVPEDDSRNLADARNKFDLDIDIRAKPYESIENDLRCRTYDGIDDFRMKSYDLGETFETRSMDMRNKMYDGLLDTEFRTDRNFEPLVINSDLQGLDMSARSYHNYGNLNRYHHLYPDIERPSVDLRLNYSPPPPPPAYTHADILRVVSIDSVDLSLRSQITNSRLLTDHTTNPHRISLEQSRLLTTDLTTSRHINTETRLMSELGNRLLSDHTTNRLLSNDQLSASRLLSTDQRMLSDETRLLTDQSRLLDQSRMLGDTRMLPPVPATGTLSPAQYTGYSVSPSPYHPTALPPRPHNASPAPSYHHYSAYY